jgi:hypothetical protein
MRGARSAGDRCRTKTPRPEPCTLPRAGTPANAADRLGVVLLRAVDRVRLAPERRLSGGYTSNRRTKPSRSGPPLRPTGAPKARSGYPTAWWDQAAEEAPRGTRAAPAASRAAWCHCPHSQARPPSTVASAADGEPVAAVLRSPPATKRTPPTRSTTPPSSQKPRTMSTPVASELSRPVITRPHAGPGLHRGVPWSGAWRIPFALVGSASHTGLARSARDLKSFR